MFNFELKKKKSLTPCFTYFHLQEKVDSQYAHGLQELEFIREHSDTEAARLCVDQWLKMPGKYRSDGVSNT